MILEDRMLSSGTPCQPCQRTPSQTHRCATLLLKQSCQFFSPRGPPVGRVVVLPHSPTAVPPVSSNIPTNFAVLRDPLPAMSSYFFIIPPLCHPSLQRVLPILLSSGTLYQSSLLSLSYMNDKQGGLPCQLSLSTGRGFRRR